LVPSQETQGGGEMISFEQSPRIVADYRSQKGSILLKRSKGENLS
jgi:hypothetical protein